MVWWRAPRAESTCKWPSESLVWGHNGGRGNLPYLHHFNSNFLPRRVNGSKQIIKLFLHLSCLFVWHLATTKHNLRARHVLSDLARANYGTSVVAECNAWSGGKSTKAARLQLCAPVTKVWKRGGRPQPPASEKPGITATLTERSQDPTSVQKCVVYSSHYWMVYHIWRRDWQKSSITLLSTSAVFREQWASFQWSK